MSSLERAFEETLRREFAAQPLAPATLLVEEDLQHLPPPVRRFIRRSGAVGKPKAQNFRLEFDAGMTRKPGGPTMPATSVQYNFFGCPARFFFMRARMFGLPVRVQHAYVSADATMVVRVASLLDIVNLAGEELSRGETVTVLNDMCCFAPGALIDPRLQWTAVDERRVQVGFRNERHRVAATLVFDERDELVDFVSDDRPALQDDGTLRAARWSTPISDYREIDGRRLPTRGDAVYHYPEGPFTYGVFNLKSIVYDLAAPRDG